MTIQVVAILIRILLVFLAGWKLSDLLKGMFLFNRGDKESMKKAFKNLITLVIMVVIILLPIISGLNEIEKKKITPGFVINTIYGQQIIKEDVKKIPTKK